jgi:hypothetical protein
MRDIPTITVNFHTTVYEAIVVFGAPERLAAFDARNFLVFSHQK